MSLLLYLCLKLFSDIRLKAVRFGTPHRRLSSEYSLTETQGSNLNLLLVTLVGLVVISALGSLQV
jgi:hypothetical protein